MAESKYFLRQIAFIILLLSISSPSFAHNKSTTTTTPPPPSGCCACPSGSPPLPSGSPPPLSSSPPSGSPPLLSDSPPPSSSPPRPSGSSPPSGSLPPSSSPPPSDSPPLPPSGSPPVPSGSSPPSGSVPPSSSSPPSSSPPLSDSPPLPPSSLPPSGSPPTPSGSPPPSGSPAPPSGSLPPSSSPPPSGSPAPPSGSLPPSGSPTHPSGSLPPLGSPPPSGSSPPSSLQIDFQNCFSRIFAFGDSYTDTGNAQLMGGLESFIFQQISRFTSSQLPGYRLCNGRLVIDFLCEALSIPTLRPYADSSAEFSKGVNFAIAGSTALSQDFYSQFNKRDSLMWKGNPESCDTQINWFQKFIAERGCKGMHEEACRGEMANSLFWIGEMGGNDYARLYSSHFVHKLVIKQAVGHVHKLLRIILDKGARFIVVQGLPPAGCQPLHLSFCSLKDRDQYGCSNIANSLIMAHNELLQLKLEELRRKYSNAMIIYADYWKAYQTILTNYRSYQFEQPFAVCCGAGGGQFNFDLHSLCGSAGTSTCKDANKYINWDGIHLTEAMHKHVSDLFFHKDHCRPSFAELIMKKKQMMMGSSP